MFNHGDDFQRYRRHLPHWRISGAIYFVTWRLATGQPDLAPSERSLIRESLLYADGRKYHLLAYVVMNDHLHVLVQPMVGSRLESLVHSWKSFTANHLQRHFDRNGSIWQAEYFDRIVRDEAELWAKVEYTLNNPRKRWPELLAYEWMGYFPGEEDGPPRAAKDAHPAM